MKTFQKPFILIFSILIASYSLQAQNVGIGTNSPDASAKLDVVSTDKGLLIPRVNLNSTADGTTIPSPATGLIVWNTGSGSLTSAGLYYNSGTSGSPNWVRITADDVDKDWFEAGTTDSPNDISDNIYTTGNISVGDNSPVNAANIKLAETSSDEGGEIQFNGGSSYTSNAYALDNYEGRLRILETTNASGTANVSGTSEFISFKRTSGTAQMGIGLIGGNSWPSESNLIIGDNGGVEGGQIQFYNADGAGTSWFLDVESNNFRFMTGNNITGSSSVASLLTNTGDLVMAGSVRALDGEYLFENGCDNSLKLQADGNAVIYYGNGGYGGWASGTNCSDMRLKENVTDLEYVLPILNELDVIRYNYKKETGLPEGRQIGVNAQQLFKYFPEMVYYNEEKDQYIVYYAKLTTLLIKGMQEQQDVIDKLNVYNEKILNDFKELKEDIEELKKLIKN